MAAVDQPFGQPGKPTNQNTAGEGCATVSCSVGHACTCPALLKDRMRVTIRVTRGAHATAMQQALVTQGHRQQRKGPFRLAGSSSSMLRCVPQRLAIARRHPQTMANTALRLSRPPQPRHSPNDGTACPAELHPTPADACHAAAAHRGPSHPARQANEAGGGGADTTSTADRYYSDSDSASWAGPASDAAAACCAAMSL